MKILKYVVGTLVVLFGLFLLIGVFTPSVKYTNEITIDKPVKESWAVMMDESKTDQWLTGLKSYELISGTKNEVGSKYKMIMVENGEEMEMTETITAKKDNEHMAMHFDSDIIESDLDMVFIDKEGKTYIKTNAEAKGKNAIWRSVFALSKSHFVEGDMTVLKNMKKVIEENTTDYFPAPVLEANAVSEGDVVAEEAGKQ